MTSIVTHIPLALFTTLGALGAGAFIGLAIAFIKGGLAAEELRRIDRLTPAFFVIALVGLIAVFFHVASPLSAFGVFAEVGSSPLSNEVLAFAVFMVLALVYSVLAFAGKLGGARMALAVIVGALAIIAGFMMGMAYMVETIPSWNNPGSILQMLGFVLAGAALALLAVPSKGAAAKPIRIVAFVGMGLAVIGLIVQIAITCGMGGALVSGSALVAHALPYAIVGVIALAASAFILIRDKVIVASVVLAVGVLAARLAFYAMELGLGL